jgi:hypothetical protein
VRDLRKRGNPLEDEIRTGGLDDRNWGVIRFVNKLVHAVERERKDGTRKDFWAERQSR